MIFEYIQAHIQKNPILECKTIMINQLQNIALFLSLAFFLLGCSESSQTDPKKSSVPLDVQVLLERDLKSLIDWDDPKVTEMYKEYFELGKQWGGGTYLHPPPQSEYSPLPAIAGWFDGFREGSAGRTGNSSPSEDLSDD